MTQNTDKIVSRNSNKYGISRLHLPETCGIDIYLKLRTTGGQGNRTNATLLWSWHVVRGLIKQSRRASGIPYSGLLIRINVDINSVNFLLNGEIKIDHWPSRTSHHFRRHLSRQAISARSLWLKGESHVMRKQVHKEYKLDSESSRI